MTRFSPGPCGICGADHSSCTPEQVGPLTQTMLPARDAAGGSNRARVRTGIAVSVPAPLAFTTATYRGRKAAPASVEAEV